jgi:putative hemolysin
MDPASLLLSSLLVIGLLALVAWLAAAESALLAVHRTRIEQLARAGDRRAGRVQRILAAPDGVLAALHLALAAATLGLGFLAAAVARALTAGGLVPAAAGALAFGGALFLHPLLGQRLPRALARSRADAVALATAAPLLGLAWLAAPAVAVIRLPARPLARLVGLRDGRAFALTAVPDQVRLLVEQQEAGGGNGNGDDLLHGVLDFNDRVVREVMTPRPDVRALPVTATRAEVVELITREQHSRIPVYGRGLDDIVGVLLVKDLIPHLANGPGGFDLAAIMREPYFIPDTKPVADLLAEFRAKNVHIAIVLDEFGGTHGLVTLEDLLEEIVGEINDEFDQPEPDFTFTAEGDVLIDGGTAIDEVNELLGLRLPEEDYDTVGGYVFGELGRVPVTGDAIPIDDARWLRVESTEERRITMLRLVAPSSPWPAPGAGADAPADAAPERRAGPPVAIPVPAAATAPSGPEPAAAAPVPRVAP